MEGDEFPPFADAPIGLLEPLPWVARGDITLLLEEDNGEVGDVAGAGCICAVTKGWDTVGADDKASPTFSSLSSSSELNQISSSSSNWRGSRRNRVVVRSKYGTLMKVFKKTWVPKFDLC